MSIATTADIEIARARLLLIPLISAAGCVALADFLFYGWTIGISLPLFFLVLGVVAVARNPAYAPRRIQIAMSVVFTAVLIALIEDVNILSAIFGALGTGFFVMVITAQQSARWQRHLLEVVTTPFRGPFQFVSDLIWQMQKQDYAWLKPAALIAWIIPLSISALFVWLFASANPLIEHGLLQIDLHAALNLLNPWRMVFWVLLAGVIWPLIFRRSNPRAIPQAEVVADNDKPSTLDFILSASATVRSLVLFNALFALQSGLDLTYLWGGANLPDGMTLAEYAHRGAYPLIITALLAAGFVLIAMRPNGPAQQSRLIRPLVLAWTGQNILLVISSILRLDLYVGVYSLTYLRLAAFIWMGLVAAGLILILIQIVLRKSNSWLLSANAATLALVLYACCFINAPWLVATYNVEHCRELGGKGPNLDVQYLGFLGPQARLVLESHRAEVPALLSAMDRQFPDAREALSRPENWRAWSFRAWRLRRYLANTPDTPPALSNGNKG
ncbi:DUF4173 domain-containing protein [Bradyrhizobium sp. dw_411]|uniref:DUF4153 domain-containing protein n=1 Tax=Bradyrhizobium sp. dw_411 TaxID=2720082 RepID=UPI001BCAD57A|nr:DUF4173 domain-containing protein [Bradyrhizobium sp. dw_411]